jgi:hypothetical protein
MAIDISLKPGKEKSMSNDNSRVLTRRGARSLTEKEIEEISGGSLTLASVLATGPASNPDDILDQ